MSLGSRQGSERHGQAASELTGLGPASVPSVFQGRPWMVPLDLSAVFSLTL